MGSNEVHEIDLSVYKPETDGVLVLNDRYELTEFLNQGGMGRLYVGTDRVLKRKVVVKILLPQLLDNQKFAKRFQREAQTLSKINHPHLLAVHDYGVYRESYPFIITEYIRGISLGDMIGDRGRIPVVETAEILIQVCDGLQAAHKEGIIHRDMKPENILVTKGADEEWVKVIDFGLAIESFVEQTRLTVSGSFLGTMPYMAPEQFDRSNVDARTDVYSVGIIFYEMLTGVHPYNATSIHQFYLQHAEAPIPNLDECIPPIAGYVPALQDILEQAIAKAPEDRYPNMMAFKRGLKLLTGARLSDTYNVGDVAAAAETLSLPRPRMSPFKWIRRHWGRTKEQIQRAKLLGMMLFVAFATAMGMLIFEKMVGGGESFAQIESVMVGRNLKAPEFSNAPALRILAKGTAKNCRGRGLHMELRVMDADGKPLSLVKPTDGGRHRRWLQFVKEKDNFGYSFPIDTEEGVSYFSKSIDLPYFLFVPPDAQPPFTFFVSTRVLTAGREVLATKDTDFLEAPENIKPPQPKEPVVDIPKP